MKKISIIVSFLIAANAFAFGEDRAPNFILILADDLGWGSTSAMADPQVPESRSDFFRTPNVERLAADGMRFTQGYAPHCNCSPTRASILTGQSPAALHFTDIVERKGGVPQPENQLVAPRHAAGISAEDHTLPELLKAARPEYRTAHFGKWHVASGGPEKHGYDVSDGPTGNGEGNQGANLPNDPKKAFSITERAIEFIRQQKAEGHPFYLQVSHYATHLREQSRPDTLHTFQAMTAGKRHNNVPFGAMLNDLDTAIGRLLDAVKEAGIAEHTYIIFTSDNGGNPTDDPGNINGPVRGWKASLWEGGVRVPFIVTGPGIKAGSVSRTPVVGYDILPTVCDLAGVGKWPKAIEGGSLKPVLADPSAGVKRPHDFLVFHWPHYQNAKGSTPDTTILRNGWKLHYWWETDSVQLFHLSADLAEEKDVAQAEPERAAELKKLLTDYLSSVSAQRPTPNPGYDPSLQKKVRRTRNPDADE